MTKHDNAFYVEGINEHIAAIKSYLPETKEVFLADKKTQDAVLMRLLAIGEEISHISDLLGEQTSQLEWYKIIGLRNRIAHGYFEVDEELIWDTLTDGSLDELSNTINKLK